MKLLRTFLFAILFLVGVFLASANTASIELVYLPRLPFGPYPEGASVHLPIFLVVLAAVLLGVIVTGLGVFAEQLRLRLGMRSQRREAERLAGELEQQTEDMRNLRAELAEAREEARRLREEGTLRQQHDAPPVAPEPLPDSDSVLGAAMVSDDD